MTNDVIFNKYEVAKYLIYQYHKAFNGRLITPIKLQKGLYFLFAMWGGKILSGQADGVTDIEISVKGFHPYLFEPRFFAWRYGPVDEDIYHWFKNHTSFESFDITSEFQLKPETGITDEEYQIAADYIDNLSKRIFNTGDFALVDLSHQDECWKEARSRDETPENTLMNNRRIIEEYAQSEA